MMTRRPLSSEAEEGLRIPGERVVVDEMDHNAAVETRILIDSINEGGVDTAPLSNRDLKNGTSSGSTEISVCVTSATGLSGCSAVAASARTLAITSMTCSVRTSTTPPSFVRPFRWTMSCLIRMSFTSGSMSPRSHVKAAIHIIHTNLAIFYPPQNKQPQTDDPPATPRLRLLAAIS
jgi:hypothetical protein